MVILLALLLVVLAAGVSAVAALFLGGRREGRAQVRLERFARRQQLWLSPANAALVQRSLAITHRWRVLGVWTGIAISAFWALREGRLTLDFIAAFLGWFAGAVIAEWRLAGLPVGSGTRVASLQPRKLWSYLRPRASIALAAAWLALISVFAVVIVGSAGPQTPGEAIAILAASGVGLTVVWLTIRPVAARPQPTASADLVAADDALRARSTNVLTGAAVVAAGVPTAQLLALAGTTSPWQWAALAALVVALLTGYLIACTASPARVDHPGPQSVATRS